MTARLRVLFVLPSGELGGAELSLITYLSHRPADVEARALTLSAGRATELLAADGVPAEAETLVGRPSPAGSLAFERRAFRLLRSVRPDLVYATGIKAALMVAPAARAARVPILWHKVDFSWERRLARPLSRLVNGVVGVSEAAVASLPRSRVAGVVHPPVRLDTSFRVGADRPPATLLSAGRLVSYKGHEHVVDAAARLRDAHPELRVIIAGAPSSAEPGYPAQLERLVERLGMADRVEMLGHVDRFEDVLERATVFVNATFVDEQGFGMEGLSGAVLEASWAGLPVVATRGGGTPEGLEDGVTGALVPPADPAALASALERYLGDREAARAAGDAGARFTRERFRPEEVSARLFSLVRAAARSGRRAS